MDNRIREPKKLTLFGQEITITDLGFNDHQAPLGVSIQLPQGVNGDDLVWAMRKHNINIDSHSETNGALTVRECIDREIFFSVWQQKSANLVEDVVEVLQEVGKDFSTAADLKQAREAAQKELDTFKPQPPSPSKPSAVNLHDFAQTLIHGLVYDGLIPKEKAGTALSEIPARVELTKLMMEREREQQQRQ